MRLRRRGLATVTGLFMLAGLAAPVGAQPLDEPLDERGLFEVRDTDVAQRTTIADSGVDVWGVHDGTMTFAAEPEQVQKLRAAGLDLVRIGDLDRMLADHNPGVRAAADEFPPGDEAYHTYTELTEVLRQTVSDHGDIAKLTSIGKSYEGRDLHLITISGNVEVDEDEPEVLFTCNQHAREHLTTEMCLRIIQRFTDEYGQDPTVTELVDTREIHVIPTVNPDGAEYDIEGGRYRGWRKNRQGNGTDLNRNWGYQWGCCGGSSGSPSSDTYRGPEPFSAPETAAVAEFVDSRVVSGTQQITAHIDFHSYSELVLWPFGYTYSDTTERMTPEQAKRFQDVGARLAASNGYTPQQSSDLYITDGSINDWMWAEHGILSFTFEMYPTGGGLGGFYPPGDRIEPETKRNDEAVEILLTEAGAA